MKISGGHSRTSKFDGFFHRPLEETLGVFKVGDPDMACFLLVPLAKHRKGVHLFFETSVETG